MKKISLPYKINIDKDYLKKYFKNIIQNNNMRGMYYINIYYNDSNTVIEIMKHNMDYYDYSNEIDLNIMITENIFLYEIDNIIPNMEIIIYKNKMFIEKNDNNLCEFTKLVYKNTENIINNGKRIKYLI